VGGAVDFNHGHPAGGSGEVAGLFARGGRLDYTRS
jgi:hypothetical protein